MYEGLFAKSHFIERTLLDRYKKQYHLVHVNGQPTRPHQKHKNSYKAQRNSKSSRASSPIGVDLLRSVVCLLVRAHTLPIVHVLARAHLRRVEPVLPEVRAEVRVLLRHAVCGERADEEERDDRGEDREPRADPEGARVSFISIGAAEVWWKKEKLNEK